VDDDASLIETLTAALSPLCRVSSVSDGQSALAFLQTNRTDLILLDLNLPDGDGLDLLPRLRQVSPAHILLMTGYGTRENLVRAVQARPDDYLDKPFDLHVLRNRVAAHLGLATTTEDRLMRVRARIAADFSRPLTTEDIARAAGMSSASLRRGFTERFGMTPRDYLEECRLTRAATLLRETDKPIREIAPEVGFRYADNFSTAFKRFHGVSPEAFRARHRPSPAKTTP
jgi:AraC-like DNA-binding protein